MYKKKKFNNTSLKKEEEVRKDRNLKIFTVYNLKYLYQYKTNI